MVNVPSVVEYASKLDNVAHAQESLFACSTDNAQQIADVIRDKGLNRVVIAACTPRTHEPLFRDTVREGGVNQYFMDMANIREHCSWVHSREKDEATAKAKDIVRMSVARTSLLKPLQEIELPINKAVLVIGGGVAGMTSALNMAEQGFEVYLVEKDSDLGGMARRIHYTLEGVDVQAHLADLMRKVYKHPRSTSPPIRPSKRLPVMSAISPPRCAGEAGSERSATAPSSSPPAPKNTGRPNIFTGKMIGS